MKVAKITKADDRVTGVLLADGKKIKADYVISTADTKVTFNELLDRPLKPNKYYEKVKKMKMSPSGFSIQLGLDDDLDLESLGFNCGYNVLTTPGAHEKIFNAYETGPEALAGRSLPVKIRDALAWLFSPYL